jgi:signal transduction histidine kinase
MDAGKGQSDQLQKEVDYYKSQVDAITGAVISLEYKVAEMSNEITQLRKGLGLIAALQDFPVDNDLTRIYEHFTEQVNLQLLMDRSLMLFPSRANAACFSPAHLKGYASGDAQNLLQEQVLMPDTFLAEKRSLLFNSQTAPSEFTLALNKALQLRYFILTPILVQDEIMAFLVAGRKVERVPLASSRLLIHDVHALEAIAGVIAAIRNQYDRFQLLDAERTRIAREMHDEIGSGLTHISMLSDNMRRNAANGLAAEAHMLSSVSRELVQNMAEIIWSLNPEHSTLESLIIYLREQVNRFLEPSGMSYVINFLEPIPHVVLTNAQRRNLYLTVKEAVNNALKYSSAGLLEISAHISDGCLHISVVDNGKGFISDQVRHTANGLRNMQRRMEEIGGRLEIQSAPGTGTSMHCRLALVPNQDAGNHLPITVTTTFM